MKTYLVTGAAGFIGAAIAKRLLSEGNKVITIDNLSTGIESNIPAGTVFFKGDVADSEVIAKLNNYPIDVIIHIAGQSSGEVSFENPVYDLQTNTQSTLLLLDYARKNNIKEFVYASSMAVYGDQDPVLVSEETLPTPKSFYAVGKLASENYMRIFSNSFGIRCTALRFFNVYGIGQNMGNLKQGMASIYLAMAIKEHHITVKGAKDRFRDFVYVDDVVDAVLLSVCRTGKDFEVYNVSNQKMQTVESIVDLIAHELPYKVSAEYVTGTPGDQHGIYGENEKIRKELGWCSKYSFDEGMKKMIEWAQGLNF